MKLQMTIILELSSCKLIMLNFISGNLELLEPQNSTWLAPHELSTINRAPVNRPAVKTINTSLVQRDLNQ